MTTVFKKNRQLTSFGLTITVTPEGFSITAAKNQPNRQLEVELYRAGRLVKNETFLSRNGWKDADKELLPEQCGIRVLDMNGNCVASLDVEEELYPFLYPRDEQVHITENYVSVPPALTITDSVNSVWTLGMETAEKRKSPDGEFAFPVLRNGVNTGEIASRIERRSGKIKIFTCEGWKTWTGRSFF